MLHAFLEKNASQRPDRVAVIQGTRRVTYGELGLSVSRLASFLIQAGVQKGDRVGIVSRNSPEYIAAYIGIQQAGGIAVDINYQDSSHEIGTIVRHCRVSALIVDNHFMTSVTEVVRETPWIRTVIGIERRALGFKSIRERIPRHIGYVTMDEVLGSGHGPDRIDRITEGDIASIIYTSGTTGTPKGVMLSHENLQANARSIITYLGLSEDDRVMAVLPFCYSYGKSLLTTHVMAGGSLVLENGFVYPQTVFTKMVDEEVTGFAGVPSTFAIMLNRSNFSDFRFPKLRYVTQAGGAMPPHHALKLAQLLPATKIYIMYGQTEATARLTYLEPDELLKRPGSIGKAIPGVEVAVVLDQGVRAPAGQEGELVARGKNIMAGYWNDPEATDRVLKNGWLHTGDLGCADKDGYLTIVGRRSDMIKSGAHRISPKEIEDVIHDMDQVHEVSIVGIHDDVLGEAIRAVVVLKNGCESDAHQVQRHCKTKLAAFKIPKEVVFVETLPKTMSGKVKKFMLRTDTATLLQNLDARVVMP
jgi:long-chain acyl-CoA synthetase